MLLGLEHNPLVETAAEELDRDPNRRSRYLRLDHSPNTHLDVACVINQYRGMNNQDGSKLIVEIMFLL